MKVFWDNLLHDLFETGATKEKCVEIAGKLILDDPQMIENSIRNYDGEEALKRIDEYKRNY